METSEEELDQVIDMFIFEGVSELVLDLRYNGGGRLRIASKLAVQIAGDAIRGETARKSQHNRTYSRFNFESSFPVEDFPSLDLDRVLVLTSGSTASASEAVINTLRPYMDVVVFGNENTVGKPFTSYNRQYCGKTLNAMQHINVNSLDVSVEGGVALTCAARDDVTRNFGTLSGETEGMLSTAVDYLVTGTCDVPLLSPLASREIYRGKMPLGNSQVLYDSYYSIAE